MSYPTDHVRDAYSSGLSKGFAWGEQDVAAGLGITSNALAVAREDVDTATSRVRRAYTLGYLRGYREAVRTYVRGSWGL